jgi:hypothetical protein
LLCGTDFKSKVHPGAIADRQDDVGPLRLLETLNLSPNGIASNLETGRQVLALGICGVNADLVCLIVGDGDRYVRNCRTRWVSGGSDDGGFLRKRLKGKRSQ